ncbi:MAG: hypothetical protein R2828_15725 [Saprospiraceae bacterium]
MKQRRFYSIWRKLSLLSAFVILLLMTNCGKDTEAKVRLSSNERALMDSLYVKQIGKMRPIWDSICESQFESAVLQAVDSLLAIRIEEEIQLRARINKQQ